MRNILGEAILEQGRRLFERQKRLIRFANEVTREVYDGLTEEQRWESAVAEDKERASGSIDS